MLNTLTRTEVMLTEPHFNSGYNAKAYIDGLLTVQMCLETLEANFRLRGIGVFADICRKFNNLTLGDCKDVTEYTTKFRQTDNELRALDPTLGLPEGIPSLKQAWVFDTGCIQHICCNRDAFIDFKGPKAVNHSILGAFGPSGTAQGIGTARVICNIDGRRVELLLSNTLYIPSANANLLSSHQLLL